MTRARDVANLIGSGNYSSTTFTATAGQTAFTISHTQGFIQVFMNGLLLDETVDYTSNGSAVTLTSGAAAGDEIEVVAYNTFSVGDALNQAAADTRYVNTSGDTVTGALTVDTSTTTNLTVDSANYGGIQFKAAGTNTGYITSFTGATEAMYIGGADTVNIHTGTNHGLTNGTTRLQIDASGRVTMPYQPAFAVYKTASTGSGGTITHNGSWSNVGNHYSSSTGRFTCPVAGTYFFYCTGLTMPNGNVSRMSLFKNGSTQAAQSRNENVSGDYLFIVTMGIMTVSAGDYVTSYYANDDGGTNLYSDTSPYITFGGYLIG